MRYVTAALVTGGAAGHRLKDQWTAKIMAHLYNLTYVHFPFPQDTWPVNGRLPNEPLWETFLGFGDNEIQFHQLDLSKLKIVRIDKTEWCGLDLEYVTHIVNANPDDNTLFFFTESARIMLEQLSDADRSAVVCEIRNKYWNRRQTDPLPSYFNHNHLNVAMHVRRGTDVAPGGRAPWRATPDSYYQAIVENIRDALPQFTVDFHIYSEGPPEIFESYRNIPNLFFHFCPWPPFDYQDLFRSFHHMITADILVTATSEFSYVVAHMNPNLTITLPVERVVELPQEPRHLKSKPDGSFDKVALQKYFAKHSLPQKNFEMPLYIYYSENDATPTLDRAMQWAYSQNLEPILVKENVPANAGKYLQLERPEQRIEIPQAVAAFHKQNDFESIIDQSGKIIAKGPTGSGYIFRVQ